MLKAPNNLWLLLAAPAGVAPQQAAEGADEGEHAMLRVLVSQRDRFRSRAQQLEEQAAQVGLAQCRMVVSSVLRARHSKSTSRHSRWG